MVCHVNSCHDSHHMIMIFIAAARLLVPTTLNLSDNVCSHQIISSIFEGLKHNSTLHYLNLRGVSNITDDDDAKRIALVLKSNHSLQELNIFDCSPFDCNGIDLILESLMSNSTLQTLCIMFTTCSTELETLSAFARKRSAKNLPPIDIVISHGYSCSLMYD